MRQTVDWSREQLSYKAGLEASRLIGWMTTADGYCFYLSPQWYEFTGHQPGQAEGYGWLDAIHIDDRARTSEAYFTANRANASYGVEYRLRSRSGKAITSWAYGVPSRSEDGAFNGFLGITNPLIGIVDAMAPEPAVLDGIAYRETPVPAPRARLVTPREREVLSSIAAGLTDERIAIKLNISARTVAAHAQSAIQRIGANNRAHACVLALRLNEIDFPQHSGQ